MPDLTNFSVRSTTRLFYEPGRRVSVFRIVGSLPTPLFLFSLKVFQLFFPFMFRFLMIIDGVDPVT